MPAEPFPRSGQDGPEPQRSGGPVHGHGHGPPARQEGLFVCLPAETAPPGTANLGTSCDGGGGPGQRPPPQTRAQDYLRSLGVRLSLIARGSCDHRHAETGYQPSRKLRHLVRARSTKCSAPGCGRPAARCDLDHTIAWDKGGMTCTRCRPTARHVP